VVLTSFARRLLAPARSAGADGTDGTDGGAPGAQPGSTAGTATGGGTRRFLAEFRSDSLVSAVKIPPAVQVTRLCVIAMVVITVPLFTPNFGIGPQGIAMAVALAISAVAWGAWQLAEGRPRLWLTALVVMAAAGGTLAGLSSLSTAVSVSLAVAVSAGARLSAELSLAVVAETVAAFLIAALVSDAPPQAIVGWGVGIVGLWAFGLTRRAYLLRAIEAEQALEQARRAHAAETQAAALGERARIAREIHDVLAHSLAAVSVNLQAATGLLDALPDSPELAKALECVERAGALTREGMAEARRAILALRGDMEGDTETGDTETGDTETNGAASGRLVARLRTLAQGHGAAGDAHIEFTVTGTPRPLGADGTLTAYRTAQEALTNARKHAPGRPVLLALDYAAPDAVTLQIANALPESGTSRPLAAAGAGYGLTGLRERAALAGGTLAAGPRDGQWQVLLTLPA
jgi:signal transduction histidine kinase